MCNLRRSNNITKILLYSFDVVRTTFPLYIIRFLRVGAGEGILLFLAAVVLHPQNWKNLGPVFEILSRVTVRNLISQLIFALFGPDPDILESRRWHTLISCLQIVTVISFATSTTRSYISLSFISNPKMRMSWPYCSFESAQIKLVTEALIDGGDVQRFSNADAAQKPHKKAIHESWYALRQPFWCPHTQSLPSGPVLVHWAIIISVIFCLRILRCSGGNNSQIKLFDKFVTNRRKERNFFEIVSVNIMICSRNAVFCQWEFLPELRHYVISLKGKTAMRQHML